MRLPEHSHEEAEVMDREHDARDAREGIGAFIEKREPQWAK